MSQNFPRSFLVAASVVMLAGCTTLPRDPFLRAEQAMQRRDLATALSAYDAVPVAHPRYPEARAAASAVELSMRHGHELLLEALQLRGQWRDGEALIVLERARSVWPAVPGIDALVAATAQRLQLFARESAAIPSPMSPPAAPAAELVVVGASPLPAESLPATPIKAAPTIDLLAAPRWIEVPVAAESPAPVTEPNEEPTRTAPEATKPTVVPPPAPEPATAPPALAPPQASSPEAVSAIEDPVSRALVAVELRLLRREIEPAVLDLLDLERRHPQDLRIRPRLARLLHQRALLRYGSGSVDLAVRDWERVLTLDPLHADARAFLGLARDERQQGR